MPMSSDGLKKCQVRVAAFVGDVVSFCANTNHSCRCFSYTGKDIFQLDKVLFPINVGAMHWVCAVAFMQDKKIRFYDSLGDSGRDYLEALFRYIKDEHKDKKKCDLTDVDDWELIPCTRDTPRQHNGAYTHSFIGPYYNICLE
jgi:hypothetical protein